MPREYPGNGSGPRMSPATLRVADTTEDPPKSLIPALEIKGAVPLFSLGTTTTSGLRSDSRTRGNNKGVFLEWWDHG